MISKKKILITYKVFPELIEALEEQGFDVKYDKYIKKEKAATIIQDYHGLIVGGADFIVDDPFLELAKKLEFVGRPGSGLDTIDLKACEKRKITVINSPESNMNAVAEHALGMLLMLLNNLRRADYQVRNKIWDREGNRGFELMGKTIGIIGFGHNGSQFAKKLSGMGVDVLAYDKFKKDYATSYDHVTETSLEEIWIRADIISFHVQLKEDTHHYLNADFIARCHKKIIVINTSRGSVVDTQCLLKAIQDGLVSGACLDVLENENTETYSEKESQLYQSLFNLDELVFSPHVAGWSFKSKRQMSMLLFDKILRFYR